MNDLVNKFAQEIKKISKEMRREGNKPGMPVYVLTIADKLERVAESYTETAWEISMGEDL